MNLGTERHKKQYFDAIDKFQIPGQPNSHHFLLTVCIQLKACVQSKDSKGIFCFPVQWQLFPACLSPVHTVPVCLTHCIQFTCMPVNTGCFCMTELGHGSNVAALQTECVLDTTTDEWIVNTPDDSAIKWCAISTYVDSLGYWLCMSLHTGTLQRSLLTQQCMVGSCLLVVYLLTMCKANIGQVVLCW